MPNTEKQLKMRQVGMEASYLAACALADRVPIVEKSVDLEELYRFCKFHSITSVVAMALETVWKETPADPAVMQKWRQARDKSIRKNILLNAERERLLAHLESIGCWYMPLKGSLLQYDYPKFGMRQMGDNDILIDAEFSEAVYDFMVNGGYQCQLHNQGNHDEFIRQPVYNFEIHRSLFKPETSPVMAAYFRDIHSRSQRDEGNSYGWHLKPEDFYIYMSAHAYNHFRGSGIGLRHLMDVSVYLGKHKQLDWAYIDGELESVGALAFDKCCRYLSDLLFSKPERNVKPVVLMEEMLDSFFESGTLGTQEQLLRKAIEQKTAEKGKAHYFMQRMFPSRELLGVMYPSVRKRGWLVPFVWVYRLVRSVVRSPRRVCREIVSFFRKYQ
jgi:hypothetical protein